MNVERKIIYEYLHWQVLLLWCLRCLTANGFLASPGSPVLKIETLCMKHVR
jgi:hypothetical protein